MGFCFSRYPPDDVDATENKVGISSGRTDTGKEHRGDLFCRPTLTQFEIVNKIAKEKSKLPIASFSDVITSTVESNQRPFRPWSSGGVSSITPQIECERLVITASRSWSN